MYIGVGICIYNHGVGFFIFNQKNDKVILYVAVSNQTCVHKVWLFELARALLIRPSFKRHAHSTCIWLLCRIRGQNLALFLTNIIAPKVDRRWNRNLEAKYWLHVYEYECKYITSQQIWRILCYALLVLDYINMFTINSPTFFRVS